VIPLVKGADALGLPPGSRASFSGQVPAALHYEDWLAQQSDDFQRSVLGPTRFRLYQGGASLGNFASASGVRPVRDVLARLREAEEELIEEYREEDHPRDEGGRWTSGGGAFDKEAYSTASKSYRQTLKGTDAANNRALVEAAGLRVSAPAAQRAEVERALAHVIGDDERLARDLAGVKIEVVDLKGLYGSQRSALLIDAGTLRKEGPGFAAAIIRHELEHTRLTREKVPSGQQESRVRYTTKVWAQLKASLMARTNPADAKGFERAANLSHGGR